MRLVRNPPRILFADTILIILNSRGFPNGRSIGTFGSWFYNLHQAGHKETGKYRPRIRKAAEIVKEARLWTKEYVIIGLVNFLTAMNFYLLMIIVSEYAMNRFDSTPGEAGFAASIFIIGALIARLFTGEMDSAYRL